MLWLLDLKVVVVFEEGERKGLFQESEKISCDWCLVNLHNYGNNIEEEETRKQ